MRERGIVVWVVLILAIIALLNLPLSASRRMKAAVREWLAPLHELVATQSHRFGSAVDTVRGWGGLIEENQRRAEDIVKLRSRVQELESLEEENIDLRRQLNFMRRSSRTLIPAEVIARDISGWWQTIRLGKGAAAGIMPEQAVVTQEGLVGRVTDVSFRTCDVLMISDPSCRVSAFLPATGAFGVHTGKGMSWKGEVLGTLDLINKDTRINVGDEVVTSGLGGVFPKGILIGYIEKVHEDESGLYQRADVLPNVDLGTLHYVFVIADEDPVDERLRRRGSLGLPAVGGAP